MCPNLEPVMRPSYEELLEENRLLKEENRALKRRLSRLEAELARLKQEHERLKRRLGGKGDPPPFVKPARPGPGRRPGRKPGHPPANRPLPAQVDQEETLTLNRCPHCGTGLGRPVSERVRYVEDIIPPRAHVTRYRIQRHFCPRCHKLVEAKPIDVLPGHRLGIRLMAYVVWLREELRLPVNLIQRYLNRAGLKLSQGEIEHITREMAERLSPLYLGYREALRGGEAVNIDETGMRVGGKNEWLWVGVRRDPATAVFQVEGSRSSRVLEELLGEGFDGVVGSDFYSAYNVREGRKQRCWAHLLRATRELEGEEGRELHRELKRIFGEASRWVAVERSRAPPGEWLERARGWEEQVQELARRGWTDPGCRRIAKRLKKHVGELFTFVVCPGVEATNNAAERALRPYVVKRKISGGHRTWAGARRHQILMSVLETCRLRGEDFLATMATALETAGASTR